jgi:hypothetical protein
MERSHEQLQNNPMEGLRESLRKLDRDHAEQLRRAGKILNVTPANRPRQCEHVKSNGEFCGSPALRGRHHCYFHLTHIGRRLRAERSHARAEAASPESGVVRLNLPPFEDADSIQVSLMAVVDALLENRIDSKRAGLLLYALQTASSNLARTSFERTNAAAIASRYDDFEQDFELGDGAPELRKDEAVEEKLDDEHATATREKQVLEACAKLEQAQKEAEEAECIAALDDGSDVFECDPHLKFMCSIKGPLAGGYIVGASAQQRVEREAGSQRVELARRGTGMGSDDPRLAQTKGEPGAPASSSERERDEEESELAA